jgi:hypothetical protein
VTASVWRALHAPATAACCSLVCVRNAAPAFAGVLVAHLAAAPAWCICCWHVGSIGSGSSFRCLPGCTSCCRGSNMQCLLLRHCVAACVPACIISGGAQRVIL